MNLVKESWASRHQGSESGPAEVALLGLVGAADWSCKQGLQVLAA